MSIDYMPDEEARAFYDKDADCPNSFQKGWRAACEAMQAKAHPQPATDWRAACVVVQYTDGSCDIDSPSHAYWLDTKGYWRDWGLGQDKFRTDRKGRFDSPVAATDALAACPTPPPDAEVKP
jgi:hypothetical protein